MRTRLILLILFVIILFLLEYYAFMGLFPLAKQVNLEGIYTLFYIVILLASWAGFVGAGLANYSPGKLRDRRINWLGGLAFAVFVSKLMFVLLLLLQDIIGGMVGITVFFVSLSQPAAVAVFNFPDRNIIVTACLAGLCLIIFLILLYGMLFGKYKYQLKHVELGFKDLPLSFDGLRIAHFSDFHSGSFDNIRRVKRGISMIQEQDPTIILFTGDLVNSHKDEIDPFMNVLSELRAPLGKYAVLGNHDYYGSYRIRDARKLQEYWDDFYSKYRKMGFEMLNNSHSRVSLNGQQICILGVENWGKGKWFQKNGDLDRALHGTALDDFLILLSHDPTHWEEKVIPHDRHIHLTLSGHTHGMQLGVEWGSFKWSPVQYRYKRWSGLYEATGQFLYINRGFGFLGFPGRAGMWPEITMINLKKI